VVGTAATHFGVMRERATPDKKQPVPMSNKGVALCRQRFDAID
jgi:hypothetical protein